VNLEQEGKPTVLSFHVMSRTDGDMSSSDVLVAPLMGASAEQHDGSAPAVCRVPQALLKGPSPSSDVQNNASRT
jgi:hypothetical protein